MAITTKITGGGKFFKKLDEIAKQEGVSLNVGVLEGATDAEGQPIALRACYNEYGTVNTPARPAFRLTLKKKTKDWLRGVEADLVGRMDEPGAIKRAFGRMAEKVKADIKQTIASGVGPALAESTVAKKAKKGLAAPALQLVEDGDYQRSIESELKRG